MNELALSDNLEILTDEILSFGQHINKSYWEIGRIHVKCWQGRKIKRLIQS